MGNKHAKRIQLILILMLFWVAAGCAGKVAEPVELTISVAASLQDVMHEVKTVYERENEIRLHLNIGSSGSLRKQIEQGAPVDIFISASEAEIEHLIKQKIMDSEAVVQLLTNTLVLITPTESKHQIDGLEDLADDEIQRIAVAMPETVPAGMYAREALHKHGVWESLQDKLVFAKDVRQVLSYVETADAQAGIVYKSDAQQSSKVSLVTEVDPSDHSPIVYPTGIVARTPHWNEAENFLRFLQTDDATNLFKTYGFESVAP